MFKPILLLFTLLFAMTACSGVESGKKIGDNSSKDATDGVALTGTLTLTVKADEKAEEKSYELSCDEYPDVCKVYEAGLLDPVPAETACTMQYGGPQTAELKGEIGGQSVSTTFNRTNGCEMERWGSLAQALGEEASEMLPGWDAGL